MAFKGGHRSRKRLSSHPQTSMDVSSRTWEGVGAEEGGGRRKNTAAEGGGGEVLGEEGKLRQWLK